MKAVVTAGGRIAGAYAHLAGTTVKALVEIQGITMLDRVLGALRGAGASQIAVVGGEEVARACRDRVERVIGDTGSGTGNLVRALRAWPDDGEPLIYATSDMPYVSAEAIVDFLSRVPPGHVALPLAEMDAFARRFPGAPPAGITLAGERVVNGDVFTIPGGSIDAVERVAAKFFQARKRPWQMAGLVSPRLMVRFLFRRLGIGHLEEHARGVLGVSAVAVRGCRPELAFDADNVEEYEYARGHA